MEYLNLFMDYESEDMPVVYFYEVNVDDHRFCHRAIEVFPNRQVRRMNDLYSDVIEAVPIPTQEEFQSQMWGDEFHAAVVSKEVFESIWSSGVYTGPLTFYG